MGEVWKAEHVSLGAPVAIKVIVDAGFDEANPMREEMIQRFFKEAKAAAALRSPHVVQILDHGVDGGIPYIAMELLEGESLEDRLDRLIVLPPEQTVEFITHIARAISKAHEVGIVHRDLKPGNVFLVRNDDEEIAKVLDFGIAKITPTSNSAFEESGNVATRTGSVVGTPCYMSPEQALGNKTIDSRSDLWSLGVIAFECVMGKRPFDSEAFGDLIVQICARPLPVPSQVGPAPEGFDAWWAKASSRELEGRFQTAKELAEALRAVLTPDAVSRQRPTIPSQPSLRASIPDRLSTPDAFAATANQHQATHMGVVSAITPPPRKRKPMILIGALGLLLVGGGAIFAIVGKGSTQPMDQPSVAATEAPSAKPAQAPETTASVAPAQAPPDPSAAPSSATTAGAETTPASTTSKTAKPATSAKAPTTGGTTKPWSPNKKPDRLGF